jgi:hypothetical protein
VPTFKNRAKQLLESSDDTGNGRAVGHQWVMCTMRKGDLIIVRDNYNAKAPTRSPTKYLIVLIGVFTTEMDEPNGTVWARCCDYGVTSSTMKNAGEADRLRLWRPVTWVREGDWQDVANTTKTSMNGIQVQTISCFTNGTMHMVFDMLKKSRPVVAAQLPKQPVPVVPLDQQQEPLAKRPKG